MMTDKYEEFKKWFELQPNILQIVTSIESDGFETKAETENIFEVFEKEWCEKEKEKRIKNVIDYALGKQGCCTPNKFVDKIYDELKEKGLLK